MAKYMYLDIGNSAIKALLYTVSGTIQSHFICSNQQHAIAKKQLAAQLRLHAPTRIYMASSAPRTQTNDLLQLCQSYAQNTHQLHTQAQFDTVKNGYKNPAQLGVDRWLCVVAAYSEQRSCCMIIDAGTAITCDIVDPSGQHLGGQIAPGENSLHAAIRLIGNLEKMSAEATLEKKINTKTKASNTAQMAQIIYGTNTCSAINEGVSTMAAAFIEKQIHGFKKLASSNGWQQPAIYMTGNSPLLCALFKNNHGLLYDPRLLFRGMRIVTEQLKHC